MPSIALPPGSPETLKAGRTYQFVFKAKDRILLPRRWVIDNIIKPRLWDLDPERLKLMKVDEPDDEHLTVDYLCIKDNPVWVYIVVGAILLILSAFFVASLVAVKDITEDIVESGAVPALSITALMIGAAILISAIVFYKRSK